MGSDQMCPLTNYFGPLFKNILLWTSLGSQVMVGEERDVEKWRQFKIIRR